MSLNKLHPRLQDFVKDQKWGDLTDIQKKAFDPIYQGTCCVIEAPTSGGKTEAVLFPLLTRLSGKKTEGFKVLYIAPLKALLNDLALRVVPYAQKCYMEAFKWHGDVSQADKVQQMLFPADILLTTPESLEAILLRRANKEDVFRNLETIVIDEAHYFALTERGSHLVSLLERIGAYVTCEPQRIAVTATVGNPEGLLRWLMGSRPGGECIRVPSNNTKERDFKIHYFMEDGRGLPDHLYGLLGGKKSIVFERSRTFSEDTAARINERNIELKSRFPIRVKTHHSSVSKQLREEAEASIKKSTTESINAIISTSTLELGIDIGELDQVIQIGGLNSSGSFLQRVGRTGRRSGKPQFFRGLCADSEELVLLVGCIHLGLKRNSEAILFPNMAFHILAHQIICFCLQNEGATQQQIWAVVSKASCFSKITYIEFELLVNYMVEEDFLRVINGNVLLTSKKCEEAFLRANWKRLFAIFDTGPMYNVVDGKKIVGTLDSGFARSQQLPFIFVLGGQEWNALKIDHELQQIVVQKNETGIAPKWRAFGSNDVPFELAQEIGDLLMGNDVLEFLDVPAQQIFSAQRNVYKHIGWKKRCWVMDVSDESEKVYLWNFAGDKINRCLQTYLLSRIEGDITYDYKMLVIEVKNAEKSVKEQVYDLIVALRNKTEQEIMSHIEEKIQVKWFSKFSECVPEKLAKRSIIEKGMDLAGVMRELNVGVIDY